MLIRIVLVTLTACIACALPHSEYEDRIIGGETVDIKELPYQLSLRREGNHRCGASIINANWALTASHCVVGYTAKNIELVSGTSFRLTGGFHHPAKEVIMHPEYDNVTMDYDYALIKVSTKFPLGTEGVEKVKLASALPATGSMAVISGWGTTAGGSGALPDKLRTTQVPLVAREECAKAHEGSLLSER
ncbi:gammaTrypsin [Carabus blaptoides fortunei]